MSSLAEGGLFAKASAPTPGIRALSISPFALENREVCTTSVAASKDV